ncbi:Glycoside-Pentoside-Hexuronide:Cation Symporter (MFS) [Blattamonas nauphoetae]|uniref:Glycoside-Pentoside-Hexuronide:Cation Symporter (MFS) n=1 Tax=Blattamonas nauphoetae TaxID=2049346 RepID=A0ABQ9Y9K4_9EUKA|nr:Glycoside-Pentoside-Hexuronide:Cation Symporter (MFS) [Blattamonas nauphoetae]
MSSNQEITPKKSRGPPLRLFLSAMSYATVQLNTTLTGALVNPLFTSLNVGDWIKPLIWLVGPVCGLLQPFFGFWNDKATFRVGKRRPVILLGTILTIISFILFFFASINLIPIRGIRIAMGVVAYFGAHLGLNVQTPASRAIVIDLCAPGQIPLGNNFVSFFIAIGSLLSYLITALLPYPFLFGAGFSLLASIPTLIWAKEIPSCNQSILGPLSTKAPISEELLNLDVSDTNHENLEKIPLLQPQNHHSFQRSAIYQVLHAFKTVWKTHGPVLRACLVYFSSWFGLVLTFPIRLTFVAEVFYAGNPITSPENYTKGITMGSYAMIIASVTTSIFSMFSTPLVKRIDPKIVYAVPHILALLGSLFLFLFPPSLMTPKTIYIIFLVYPICFSLIISVIYSTPFSIVASSVHPSQHALYAGVLNVFSVAGQILALLLNVLIEWLAAKDTTFRHHTQWTWLQCSIGFLIVVGLSFILRRSTPRTATPTVTIPVESDVSPSEIEVDTRKPSEEEPQ